MVRDPVSEMARDRADKVEVIEATKRIASMLQKDILGVSDVQARGREGADDSAYLSNCQARSSRILTSRIYCLAH